MYNADERTLLFNSHSIIYHGSDSVINSPSYSFTNDNNDYGRGFYCTKSIARAKEWAAYRGNGYGYLNQYDIDTNGLKILDLTSSSFTALHWITMLINHRVLSEDDRLVYSDAIEFLTSKYSINTSDYDIIVGYRADDSYFSFAKAFLGNQLSLQHLSKALELGALGKQYVLASESAFSSQHLKFIDAEPVSDPIYFKRYITNDTRARETYRSLRQVSYAERVRMTYIIDLMRAEL